MLWGPQGLLVPFDEGSYPMCSLEERSAWRTIREEYLASGAIVKVNPGPESRISRAFLVVKWRMGF